MKTRLFRKGYVTGALALVLVGMTMGVASAATLSYIKFDGVNGDSTQIKHEGETDLVSWNFEVRHVAQGVGTCASVGGCTQFEDITIINNLESSTPVLFGKLATGDVIPTAKISVARSGDRPQVFFSLLFTDVQLTSMAINPGGAAGLVHTAFAFSTITMSYAHQKPDGSLDTPITAFYDLVNGTGSLPQLLTVFALGNGDNPPSAVPLPPTLAMMTAGLLAVAGWRRRAPRR